MIPEPAAPRPATFASLRIRNYRLYASGQTVSVVGTWMQNIALGWLTLELSHSGTVLGIMTGVRYLPLLFFGSWGGLVADRWDVRRLLTMTQAAMAIVSAILTVLSQLHAVNLQVLLILVLSLGVIAIFDNPARQSLISELVDERHLANAVALNSTMVNTAKLVGPGLAGLLIAAVGVTACFAVNVISFVAVLISLAMMRSGEMFGAAPATKAPGQIRAGLRAVVQTPTLLYPMLMVAVTGIMTWEFPVTLPLVTTYSFDAGPAGYGGAMACMSVGAVIGGLLATRRHVFSVRSLALSAILWGTEIGLAAVAPDLALEYVALLLAGIGAITFNSAAKTLLQMESAPQMRGRVMSLWSMGWQGGSVIGAPLVGAIGSGFGPRYALVVGAAAAVVAGLASLGSRTWRSRVRREPLEATPVPLSAQARRRVGPGYMSSAAVVERTA